MKPLEKSPEISLNCPLIKWCIILFAVSETYVNAENLLGNQDLSYGLNNWTIQALYGPIVQDRSQPNHPNAVHISVKQTPLRTNVKYNPNRSEISSQKQLFGGAKDGTPNTDLWYSWQFMIPVMPEWKIYPDKRSTTGIISQFHSFSSQECTSPSICLELRGRNLSLAGKELIKSPRCHWNANINDSNYLIDPGVWYTVVMHIMWSYDPTQGYIVARYRASNGVAWNYYQDKGDTIIHRQTLGDPNIATTQNYMKFGNYFNPGFIQWMADAGLPQWDIYFDQIRVARSFNLLGIEP